MRAEAEVESEERRTFKLSIPSLLDERVLSVDERHLKCCLLIQFSLENLFFNKQREKGEKCVNEENFLPVWKCW